MKYVKMIPSYENTIIVMIRLCRWIAAQIWVRSMRWIRFTRFAALIGYPKFVEYWIHPTVHVHRPHVQRNDIVDLLGIGLVWRPLVGALPLRHPRDAKYRSMGATMFLDKHRSDSSPAHKKKDVKRKWRILESRWQLAAQRSELIQFPRDPAISHSLSTRWRCRCQHYWCEWLAGVAVVSIADCSPYFGVMATELDDGEQAMDHLIFVTPLPVQLLVW